MSESQDSSEGATGGATVEEESSDLTSGAITDPSEAEGSDIAEDSDVTEWSDIAEDSAEGTEPALESLEGAEDIELVAITELGATEGATEKHDSKTYSTVLAAEV